MATLVLSTVGTALGGPIGGAIGALVGQSIDRELLAPSSRGPRVGDLSVQSSSYGTQVPRIYGTMRVAGSIIWATDLVESTATTGAKGQPDTTYSYSVSFAVALSSRPIASIRRIWADGKLLRGENGDFKVSTTFRFHDGSEDQVIDPLIGSIEGISSTPAYRGLALAVFENLELAGYGNRIPFLTFEVVGDEEPPTAAAILADASRSAIGTSADTSLPGYAAYGGSTKAAIQPLIDCLGLHLFDDGQTIRDPQESIVPVLTEFDLGNSAEQKRVPTVEREQKRARELPGMLRLTYYDPARDYQSGEARVTVGEQGTNESRADLPAVLDASAAKSLAQQMMARAWSERDKLTLRLPTEYLWLEPGMELDAPLTPKRWRVDQCTIDSFVVVAELRPVAAGDIAIPADSGRVVSDADVVAGDIALALFETPPSLSPNTPSLMLAATTATPGWRSRAVEVTFGDQVSVLRTASRKSKLGRAAYDLPPGQAYTISDTVEVELVDADQWLVSCDDVALASGANLAFLGNEIIQFRDALPIGPGRFRLGGLVRGLDGTEGATGAHNAGEWFALIERDALCLIDVPAWSVGSQVTATVVQPGPNPPTAQTTVGPEVLRPLRGSAVFLDGVQVVGARLPPIALPADGSTVDSEARSTLESVLAALRSHGLIEI
jgi:hypothetical protein